MFRLRLPKPAAAVTRAGAALALAAATCAPAGAADEAAIAGQRQAIAWRVLRAADCARCHGESYEGRSAPSIVAFVRTQSHARFVLIVLDGNPVRGMPAYRNNPYVATNLDGIYAYFLGCAERSITREYVTRAPGSARPPAPVRVGPVRRGPP